MCGVVYVLCRSNPNRHPRLVLKSNHIFKNEADKLLESPFEWENVNLPCHSDYDTLPTILSMLGRAPTGATRHNHHLALLLVLAKFIIVIAGHKASSLAPNVVSIMFFDEEVEEDCLNIIMGSTIPILKNLNKRIRDSRYNFLANVGSFSLLGMNASWDKWLCGHCAETFGLVLLRR